MMNRPRMSGYGFLLSLACFAGYVALATGCGKSEPAEPAVSAAAPPPRLNHRTDFRLPCRIRGSHELT